MLNPYRRNRHLSRRIPYRNQWVLLECPQPQKAHAGCRKMGGILLKGNGLAQILPELWPIALFLALVLTIGLKRYRRTLD
jgi:hypothetical protein